MIKDRKMAHVKAISVSDRKGIRKKNIDSVNLVAHFGLENDAHGGGWHRQVSLLAEESIQTMRQKGLNVVAGNFAENITTEGLDLCTLSVGTHIRVGGTELIISQLGKVCHNPCAIYHQAGDCVMPREGIFAVVLKGGEIQTGDTIEVLDVRSSSTAVICSKESQKQYGERIREIIMEKWKPGFIRFDLLKSKEDNFPPVLNDLTAAQHITRIVLFDPTSSHSMALAGRQPDNSNLYYCTSIEEINAL